MPRPRITAVPHLEDALADAFSALGLRFVSMSRKSRHEVTVVYQHAPSAFRSITATSASDDLTAIDDDLFDEVVRLIPKQTPVAPERQSDPDIRAHGLAPPTLTLFVAAAQRISVCRALLEGDFLKDEEVEWYRRRERDALGQLRAALLSVGIEHPQMMTRALTDEEVRAALVEGRAVRKELEARVSRMHHIDEKDAKRKAR